MRGTVFLALEVVERPVLVRRAGEDRARLAAARRDDHVGVARAVGTINHLGVEVRDSATVHAETARLTEQGLFTDEELGTTCCSATQDKVWVTGPAGERWEVYTVLADSATSGSSPAFLADPAGTAGGTCCGGSDPATALLLTPRGAGRGRGATPGPGGALRVDVPLPGRCLGSSRAG